MYPIFKEVGSKIVQIDPAQLNKEAIEKINEK
jgi:hypothetical protein